MLDVQLQIFKTVVEKKSFSLAAQELHMTQSSVSQHIQALEIYFGAKLFDRLHRRICLTEAGSALYPYAVSLERLYQEARDTMSGQLDLVTGRLSIAASMTIGEYLLPKILVQFNQLYPKVNITMDIVNTERVIGKTVEGNADIGFVEGVYKPVSDLEGECFCGDDLVIIKSASYNTNNTCLEAPVSIATLLEERWVLRETDSGARRVFENFLVRHDCSPAALNVIMSFSSTEAIKSAVMTGAGIGIMSRLAVTEEIKRGEVKVVKLCEGTIDRSFWILRNKAKFQTKTVNRFCAFFLSQMNGLDMPNT